MNVHQLAARVEPGQVRPRGSPETAAPKSGSGSFAEALRRARDFGLETQDQPKVSLHAQQRMQQRDISLTEEQQQQIGAAMQELSAKGANDAVLIRSDAAFVVNVPSRTIVTAVGSQELNDRIFTKIDSAMLLQDTTANP